MNRDRRIWVTEEEWKWLCGMRAVKTCAEKVPFDTDLAAMRSAVEQMTGTRGLKLYTYECPICGKWHLTKMKQRNG